MAVSFVVVEWELDQRVYWLHKDAFLLSEDAFRRQYRLAKALVRYLCERLRGELTRVRRNTATSLTVELQCMVATDEHLAITSQSSVSRCIQAVAQAIVDCLGEEWIAFPPTRAAVAATRQLSLV
ncbi:hypothetical protein HPB48_019138 [Haemaphysalis longicornis]|uniref:Uncharacterized protein n=1 Tax=Haemaphysalis longicornis TaxID=44386 RepID=A0A9J6G0G3_HAELO|nr:hypothetical protein HPB48_019138 [Haemaphysalis longicornis]